MSDHDPLCPAYVPGPLRAICDCDLIAKARADEHERIKALCRMLLDSGDITPMAVRVLTKRADDDAARIARNGGQE